MSNPWHKISKSEYDDNKMELSEMVEKVARKELREDKFARDQCLEQMRDWLSKNEDVQDVRMDDVFLLRFLRAKKFSVPMAQQLMLKYLNLKTIFPRMTTNLDFLSSPMKEVFANGYLVSKNFIFFLIQMYVKIWVFFTPICNLLSFQCTPQYVSPIRDQHGRRVIFARAGKSMIFYWL